MKGDRLWMTSTFATDVRARAMMKHTEAVAKQEAISTPGQPASRTTTASRPRRAIATAEKRKTAQKTDRQKTVVHESVETRRSMRPPVLQQSAAAATSQKPTRREWAAECSGVWLRGRGRRPRASRTSASRRGEADPCSRLQALAGADR